MKHINISEIAELTRIDRTTVSKRLKGKLTPVTKGKAHTYPAREALLIVFELNEEEIKREQVRYEKERADRMALQNARARGELVPASDILPVMERMVTAVKAQLTSVPHKAASRVRGMDSIIEIKKVLDDLVEECLRELSSDEFSRRHGFASEDLIDDNDNGKVDWENT